MRNPNSAKAASARAFGLCLALTFTLSCATPGGKAGGAGDATDAIRKQSKDGSPVRTEGGETQIYNKTANRWQLVHVHYSGPPMTP